MRIGHKFIIAAIYLLSGLYLFAGDDKTAELDSLAERYLETILPLYGLGEVNPLHAETTGRIRRTCLELLRDYPQLSRSQLDEYAMILLGMLYRDVHLGSLEDSPDARRQTFRAVTIFLGLALCSESDYTYWLDLAEYHLPAEEDDITGLRIGYFLMKGYICYARGYLRDTALIFDDLLEKPERDDPVYSEAFTALREFRRRLPPQP